MQNANMANIIISGLYNSRQITEQMTAVLGSK